MAKMLMSDFAEEQHERLIELVTRREAFIKKMQEAREMTQRGLNMERPRVEEMTSFLEEFSKGVLEYLYRENQALRELTAHKPPEEGPITK